MMEKEPSFGFWIPVTDKTSALYAAKMSGFPVFLLGLSFFISGFPGLFSLDLTRATLFKLAMFLGGLFMIVSGLRIRKLKFRTLPVSVLSWLILNSVSIILYGAGLATILTVLIGLLAISGLRGWLWLRNNPAEPAPQI